jgi:hypothetical protein
MDDVRIQAFSETSLHYVDWSAVIAGSLIALAISSLMFAFGSAIGLSLTSFVSVKTASLTGLVIAAALWFLWIQVSSFLIGGYVAGRLNRNVADASSHEMEIRDGSQGLIMWSLNVVMGGTIAAVLAFSGLGAAATSSSMDYYVEKMLRNSPTAPQTSGVDLVQVKRVITQNLASSSVDESDKIFLMDQISAKTGVSVIEAQQRLDLTIGELKAQADRVRRYSILTAFLTAASLLIGAVASWWAATTGGKHRISGVNYSHLTSWR